MILLVISVYALDSQPFLRTNFVSSTSHHPDPKHRVQIWDSRFAFMSTSDVLPVNPHGSIGVYSWCPGGTIPFRYREYRDEFPVGLSTD